MIGEQKQDSFARRAFPGYVTGKRLNSDTSLLKVRKRMLISQFFPRNNISFSYSLFRSFAFTQSETRQAELQRKRFRSK